MRLCFMFKKITFLSLGLAIVPAIAMENAQLELEPWVLGVPELTIKTSVDKECAKISVTNDMTVLDLKNKLQDLEGIPTYQQRVQAVWPVWLGLYQDRSAPLGDDVNVKNAMSLYNTKTFALVLTLRKQTSAEKKE
jgi:hypothetical protein